MRAYLYARESSGNLHVAMHQLVREQHVTRAEFLRGLEGLTDADARRRLGPMNCISWTIAHMAAQEHNYFVAFPQGKGTAPEYRAFVTGAPPSQPPLEEALALWHRTCKEADLFLHAATEEVMHQYLRIPIARPFKENVGTLILRNIFHYWSHIGEISAIRQMLGHQGLPQFVGPLAGCAYGEGQV